MTLEKEGKERRGAKSRRGEDGQYLLLINYVAERGGGEDIPVLDQRPFAYSSG